jgi:hypothetical protein
MAREMSLKTLYRRLKDYVSSVGGNWQWTAEKLHEALVDSFWESGGLQSYKTTGDRLEAVVNDQLDGRWDITLEDLVTELKQLYFDWDD